jgi:ubiquinone/menaquinone biosynthesis C-methylase UbiE
MHSSAVNLMQCPHCACTLQLLTRCADASGVLDGSLACAGGHVFTIVDGVADFGVSRQMGINAWPEQMTQDDYRHMLDQCFGGMSVQYRHELDLMLEALCHEVQRMGSAVVIDVGTGSATFAKHLALRRSDRPELMLCADLSHSVLACDRVAVLECNPGLALGCLAADAANLPLRTGSVDTVASFGGITNFDHMRCLAALQELRRVASSGVLVDAALSYDKGSPSDIKDRDYWRATARYEYEDSYGTREGRRNLFARAGFASIEERVLYSGIAGERPGDLLPAEGDRYELILVTAHP